MRQYVLDEIEIEEMGRVQGWLAERADLSGVEGLYWVNFQSDMLSQTQFEHKGCQPHCFAIELGKDSVKFELLVRSRLNYRCRICQVYASPQQRQFILEFADRMVSDLGLGT
jgi:hypothetical protein